MSVINTNVSSLVAQSSLMKTGRGLDTALERLASGLRINSAKDDAAGLAIANRLSAQIGGLRTAVRNANDGISLAQTAEGALQETTSILLRIRDLSVQSINDSNDDTDRANIQKEVTQLKAEVQRIASSTKFSGQNLLDSSFTGKVFQVGAFKGENIEMSIAGARQTDLGNFKVESQGFTPAATKTTGVTNGLALQTLTITPTSGGKAATFTVTANSSAKSIADAVNSWSANTNVKATAQTNLTLSGFAASTTSVTSAVSFSLTGASSTASAISLTSFSTSDLSALKAAINAKSSDSGITADFTNPGDKTSLVLTSKDGYDIKITSFSGTIATSTQSLHFDAKANGTNAITVTSTETSTAKDNVTASGKVELTSSNEFTINSAVSTGKLFDNKTSTGNLLKDLDVSTRATAENAIGVIDASLSQIDSIRANLGAVQNRLTSTINNLTNVANNAEAARSRVVDADFAVETASLTKFQILQQAGISILAQANTRPQAVLSLLRS